MRPCALHSAWPSRLVPLSDLPDPVTLLESMQRLLSQGH